MATNTSDSKSPFLPPRWFITTAWKVHRGLYKLSGGRFGLRHPKPNTYGLARLTTTGRRSGEPRSVMIGYYLDGEDDKEDNDIVTMAMNGWGAAEPAWWLNLQSEPHATLTTRDGSVEVAGRAARGAERDRLWERWQEIDKGLDGYAARRPNETAVVVLTPTSDRSAE